MSGEYIELIPGLESFMEDDAAAIPGDGGDEIAEVEAELAKSDAEGAELDAKAEMFLGKFSEVVRMHSYVRTYGVDRAFLTLCNYDNRLGLSCGITLSPISNCDAVSSPYNDESLACLEGLGEMLKKAWDFVVGLAKKVYQWIVHRINDIRAWVEKRKQFLHQLMAKIPMLNKIRRSVKDITAKTKARVLATMDKSEGLYSAKDLRRILDQCKKQMTSVKDVTGVFKRSVQNFVAGDRDAVFDAQGFDVEDAERLLSRSRELPKSGIPDAEVEIYRALVAEALDVEDQLTALAAKDMLSELKQLINARRPNLPDAPEAAQAIAKQSQVIGRVIKELTRSWSLFSKVAMDVCTKAYMSLFIIFKMQSANTNPAPEPEKQQ